MGSPMMLSMNRALLPPILLGCGLSGTSLGERQRLKKNGSWCALSAHTSHTRFFRGGPNENGPGRAMITNVDVYFSIAQAALAESERLENLARRPKPDGEPGFIITYDPEQKSFKNSLVAIVFAGMFLEACFYIAGVKRFGAAEYNKKHDGKKYEDKLPLFGLSDPALLAEAKRFREMRNELVHEKAISNLSGAAIHIAQDEAKKAVSFAKLVADSLVRVAPHP